LEDYVDIKEAKSAFSKKFFARSPVNSVGISRTDLKPTQHPNDTRTFSEPTSCISVGFEVAPIDWSEFPIDFEGFPVRYEVIGVIRAF
jgi:hypothetical protein